MPIEIVETKHIKSFEKGPIRRSLFSNGAVSLFHHMPGMQGAVVNLYFLVGSKDEKVSEHGIAHFIEHLMFKEGGHGQIVRELESAGAQLNAYTTKDHICMEMFCKASNLSHFLPKFLGLFFELNFTQEEFDLEKKVVIQELREEEDDHESRGHDYILNRHFDRRWGHPIGGTVKDVFKYKSQDVIHFFEKHFVSERCFLSICSGSDYAELEVDFLKAMSPHKRLGNNRLPKREKGTDKWGKLTHFKSTLRRKTENALLYIALDGPSLESKYYHDLVVLDELLCEGLTSVFFRELREKRGLIYGLGSSLNSYANTGNYVWIFNCAVANRAKVQKLVLEILEYYRHHLFSAEEVSAVKSRVMDALEVSFDQMQERCDFCSEIEMMRGREFSLRETREKIGRVGPERIRYVVNSMAKNGITVLNVLPKN